MRAFFYWFVFCTELALPVVIVAAAMMSLLFHKPLHETLIMGIVSGLTTGVCWAVFSWAQRWQECPKCDEKQELLPSCIRFGGWKCMKYGVLVNLPPIKK